MKYVFSLLILISGFATVAQTVWPVQVTGFTIPPRSLDLSVYGTDRTQDLSFTAVLNDPVEANLEVRVHLSIEQNGQLLYETDRNANIAPITLSQFQPLVLDGNALAPYLNPQALVGVGANTRGSTQVPEGFNQICVQLYGVRRNVPVSNKFCISGLFELNQPPQIVLPTCFSNIQMQETQNMIFSWQPMHLGSSNSPGAVSYDFELVQMPNGYYNINDAFPAALKVYSATTQVPNILYTQAEPILVPGRMYAWRVKAYATMNPTSLLFQNEGFSEICSFYYYEGDEPDTRFNPGDNPSPQGCEVFDAQYGPIENTSQLTTALIPSDIVKVGFFDLEITAVSGGQLGGYRGSGVIDFPMLDSKIPVSFSGLKVNDDRRVYESEAIKAYMPADLALSDNQLSVDNVEATFGDGSYADRLLNASDDTKYVSRGSGSALKTKELPLILASEEDGPEVHIIGVKFTPKGAYLHAVGVDTDDEGGKKIYAGTHIPATPYGIRNGSYLVPVASVGDRYEDGQEYVTNTIQLAPSTRGGAKMTINCRGYEEVKESNSLSLNREVIYLAGDYGSIDLQVPESTVVASDYVGDFTNDFDFEIPAVSAFVFTAQGGKVDLSTDQSLENNSDSDYLKQVSADWRGVVLDNVTTTLPEKYSLGSASDDFILSGDIYIDEDDVRYGVLQSSTSDKGPSESIGKWAYTITKATLVIEDGTTDGPTLSGTVRSPYFTDDFEVLDPVTQYANTNAAIDIPIVLDTLDMSMWHGTFRPYATSGIELEVKTINGKSQLYPSGSFDGMADIALDNQGLKNAMKGNIAKKLDDIAKALGVDVDKLDFNVRGMEMLGLSGDPFAAAADRYDVQSIDLDKTVIEIAGRSFAPRSIDMVSDVKDGNERLGLKFVVSEGRNKIKLTVWAKSEGDRFVFDQIDEEILELNCDCVEPGDDLGAVYERFVDEYYAGVLHPTSHSGGQSAVATDVHSSMWRLALKSALIEQVAKESLAGFPQVADDKIHIPFLGIDLQLEANSDQYTAKRNSWIIENSKYTAAELYAVLDSIPQNFASETLPILIGPDKFQKFGFHVDYNMPVGSKFVITDFQISKSNKENNTLEATFGIQVLYKLDNGQILVFDGNVPVKPNGANFEQVQLKLKAGEKLDDYVQFVVDNPASKTNESSHALISCTDGFIAFDVFGNYKTQKLHSFDRKTVTEGKDADFLFEVSTKDGKHNLNSFIGTILKKESINTFVIPSHQYLQFTFLEDYLAYLDYSDNKKIPGEFESFAYKKSNELSFKGIVFEKLNYIIQGIKDKKGKELSYPLEDIVLNQNGIDGEGLFSNHLSPLDLVTKADSVKMAGWGLTLTEVVFSTSANSFEYPLELVGSVQVPLFESAPKKIKSIEYAEGWVPFAGAISSYTINGATSITSDFKVEGFADAKVYKSAFIPGLGFQLETSSTSSMAFNSAKRKWEISSEFNGKAIVTVNDETMKDIGLTNYPSGIDVSLPILKYQGIKLNKGPSACGAASEATGISSIEFGTWGSIFDLDEFQKRVTQAQDSIKAYQKRNAVATPQAPTPQQTRARSNALTRNDARRPQRRSRSGATYGGDAPKRQQRSRSGAISGGDAPRKQRTRSGAQYGGDAPKRQQRGRSGAISGGKAPMATQRKRGGTVYGGTAPYAESSKSTLMGFGLSLEPVGVQCIGDVYKFQMKVSAHLAGERTKTTGTKSKTTTCSIKGEGQFYLGFKYKETTKKLVWDGVGLDCFTVGASFGPVSVEGGLAIFNSEGVNTQWGDGFRGYVKGSVADMVGIRAVVQFGKMPETTLATGATTEEYRYFLFDIEGTIESGIALPPPTPTSAPVVNLYGLGGGVTYNMSMTDLKPKPAKLNVKEQADTADNNDRCKIDNKYLKPGSGITGNSYKVEKGSYGIRLSVIMGPYVPPKSPKPIVCDGEVNVQISQDNSGFHFDLIKLRLRGFLLPSSIIDREDENIGDGELSLTWNNRDEFIAGEVKARIKVSVPNPRPDSSGDIDIVVAPKDYGDKDPKKGYNTGTLFYNLKSGADDYYFKLGSYGDNAVSKLPWINAKYNIGLISLVIQMYFQIGKNVDSPPTMKDIFPQLSADELKHFADLDYGEGRSRGKKASASPLTQAQAADGVILGANMRVEGNFEYLMMAAAIDAMIGFDVSMQKLKNVACVGREGPIGVDEWYARGRGYAYLKAALKLNYDLGFTSGTILMADTKTYTGLKVMLPNPSYMNGFLAGEYNLLDGLLKGKYNFKFELGDKCEGMADPSPLEGFSIFADAVPSQDGLNVDIFSDLTIFTNIALNKTIAFSEVDVEGKDKGTFEYRPAVDDVWLTKADSDDRISVATAYKGNKLGYTLTPDEALEPRTDYELHYRFVWQKKVDGKWINNFLSGKPGDASMKPKIEEGTVNFQTGDGPKTISDAMVEYAAPGRRQRFWHAGYAPTEIKFKKKAVKYASKLFPKICQECGLVDGKPVEYEYFVELEAAQKVTWKGDACINPRLRDTSLLIAITEYPAAANVDIYSERKDRVPGTNISIPVLVKDRVPVDVVRFPDLDKQIEKYCARGEVSSIRIIRRPKIDIEAATLVTDTKSNVFKWQSTKVNSAGADKLAANTMILYENDFAVSFYDNLADKLANASVRHQRSKVKRSDFQHPREMDDKTRVGTINKFGNSLYHLAKDDYYLITPGKVADNIYPQIMRQEGFDKYDLLRIKRNAMIKYDNNYLPAKKLRDKYQEKGMRGWSHEGGKYVPLAYWLSSGANRSIGRYMIDVLYHPDLAAESQTFTQEGATDGTEWHYNIAMPDEFDLNLLTDEEVSLAKDANANAWKGWNLQSSDSDPNYDEAVFDQPQQFAFMIQDLRSRIVINQMYWLGKLAKNIKNDRSADKQLKRWAEPLYPEALFLKDDLDRRDFSWIIGKGADKRSNYVAKEDGYKFAYHGTSSLSFPQDATWTSMPESKKAGLKRNAKYKDNILELKPDRTIDKDAEISVDVTQLSTDVWYRILTKSGTKAKPSIEGRNNEPLREKWGFEKVGSQYLIYSAGNGEVRNKDHSYENYVKAREDKKNRTLWNVTELTDNYVRINNAEDNSKHVVVNNPEVKIVEVPDLGIAGKQYYIKSFRTKKNLSHKKGHRALPVRFNKVGRFYTIEFDIPRHGRKFFRLTNAEVIMRGSDENKLHCKFEDISNWRVGTSQDIYYGALWDITDIGNNKYVIRNVRWPEYFITHAGERMTSKGSKGFFTDTPAKFETNANVIAVKKMQGKRKLDLYYTDTQFNFIPR